MHIQENISLKDYNTFGIDVKASYFVNVKTITELEAVLKLKDYPALFLIGGGSNILLTQDLNKLVVFLNIKGISKAASNNGKVLVTAMAGEVWHHLVLWSLEQGLGGMENLSLIPGNVGTAPIQNIGAYGVELKDIFHSCSALEIETGEIRSFSKEECLFGYRDSIFKGKEKGRFIILSTTLELQANKHQLHISYGAIQEALKSANIDNPSIKDISNVIVDIRKSKLPDPKEIGNSGSFYKNPVIDKKVFKVFQERYPEAPFYKLSEHSYKIPAGWLIEQCGYKGKVFGKTGVHKNQALVLVNYGGAKGSEIVSLSEKIQESVKSKFGISLIAEVNIIK